MRKCRVSLFFVSIKTIIWGKKTSPGAFGEVVFD